MLAGEEDDWGHPAARCRAYEARSQPGQVVQVETYSGVHHAFENPDLTRAVSNGHVLEYNKTAADDSFLRVHAFLDRWVGRPSDQSHEATSPLGMSHAGLTTTEPSTRH